MSIPVAQNSEIGGNRLLLSALLEFFQHSPFGRCPQHSVMWKVYPAQKVHAGCKSGDGNLVRMQGQMQARIQKRGNARKNAFKVFSPFV